MTKQMVSDEEVRQCRDNPFNPTGGILVEMATDLLNARTLVKKLERELGETRDQGIRFRQALNYITTYSEREDWPEEVIDAITEAGECEVANE